MSGKSIPGDDGPGSNDGGGNRDEAEAGLPDASLAHVRAKKRQLRPLPGLLADEFRHPQDAIATDALKKIPGFDTLVTKILEYGFERVFYVDNLASNLRVTPKMFGRLHRSLQWGCKVLDIPEPEMYVTMNPLPNAWTFGHTKPFVTVTTGLIDLLTDEELYFVIGHELGHIKAGHVLYGTMARNIALLVELIGQATLGIGALLGQSLVYALLEWYRAAELTCDRAALLCVQDLEPARTTFMKLAGGNSRLAKEMDREEFLRQVTAFEDIDRSALNKVYKAMLTSQRSHPFAMQRAKEVEKWFGSGYGQIMALRGR